MDLRNKQDKRKNKVYRSIGMWHWLEHKADYV